jgi:hypothetical protein
MPAKARSKSASIRFVFLEANAGFDVEEAELHPSALL